MREKTATSFMARCCTIPRLSFRYLCRSVFINSFQGWDDHCANRALNQKLQDPVFLSILCSCVDNSSLIHQIGAMLTAFHWRCDKQAFFFHCLVVVHPFWPVTASCVLETASISASRRRPTEHTCLFTATKRRIVPQPRPGRPALLGGPPPTLTTTDTKWCRSLSPTF